MRFFLAIALLLFPVWAHTVDTLQASEWELINSSDGVRTYERWVKINNEQKVREQKGVLEVKTGVDKVMSFLEHAPNLRLWMTAVRESYLIKKTDDNNWYTYTLFDIPWPIGDRDLVAHYHLTQKSEGIYLVSLTSINKYVPEKKNITRFLSYHGRWEIRRIDKNRTEIVHVARTDEAPSFPRYLQDPIIRSTFISSLKRLKQELEK